jgi:hypothetical protein
MPGAVSAGIAADRATESVPSGGISDINPKRAEYTSKALFVKEKSKVSEIRGDSLCMRELLNRNAPLRWAAKLLHSGVARGRMRRRTTAPPLENRPFPTHDPEVGPGRAPACKAAIPLAPMLLRGSALRDAPASRSVPTYRHRARMNGPKDVGFRFVRRGGVGSIPRSKTQRIKPEAASLRSPLPPTGLSLSHTQLWKRRETARESPFSKGGCRGIVLDPTASGTGDAEFFLFTANSSTSYIGPHLQASSSNG